MALLCSATPNPTETGLLTSTCCLLSAFPVGGYNLGKKRGSGGLPVWKEVWEGVRETAVASFSAKIQKMNSGGVWR